MFSGGDKINITFYNNAKTWIDALTFCSNNDGYLESNVTEITKLLPNNTIDVWTGQYKTRSPWLVTWGCYKVRSGWISLQDNEEECQNACTDIEYYSFYQSNRCLCINGSDLLSKAYEYVPCNCCNCFHVKKKIEDDPAKLKPQICKILVDAKGEDSVYCSNLFPFFCRFEKQKIQREHNFFPECNESRTNNGDFETRSEEILAASVSSTSIFVVLVVILIAILVYIKRGNVNNPCVKIRRTKPNVTRETSHVIQHNKESSPYSVIDDEQFSTIRNQSEVCLVDDETAASNVETNRDISYVTQNTTSSKLKLCNPVDCIDSAQSGKRLQNETDPYINNKNNDYDDCMNSAKRQEENGIGIMLHSSDYCLAKLPQNDEDPYVTSTDYDHSNRVMKLVNSSTYKVYDHVSLSIDSDPTYDHSDMLSPKPLNYNYDHLKI